MGVGYAGGPATQDVLDVERRRACWLAAERRGAQRRHPTAPAAVSPARGAGTAWLRRARPSESCAAALHLSALRAPGEARHAVGRALWPFLPPGPAAIGAEPRDPPPAPTLGPPPPAELSAPGRLAGSPPSSSLRSLYVQLPPTPGPGHLVLDALRRAHAAVRRARARGCSCLQGGAVPAGRGKHLRRNSRALDQARARRWRQPAQRAALDSGPAGADASLARPLLRPGEHLLLSARPWSNGGTGCGPGRLRVLVAESVPGSRGLQRATPLSRSPVGSGRLHSPGVPLTPGLFSLLSGGTRTLGRRPFGQESKEGRGPGGSGRSCAAFSTHGCPCPRSPGPGEQLRAVPAFRFGTCFTAATLPGVALGSLQLHHCGQGAFSD